MRFTTRLPGISIRLVRTMFSHSPRAAPVVPLVAAAFSTLIIPATTLAQAAVDYDYDGDALIEVSTLAQLNAIRWDLDGDGAADTADTADDEVSYAAAFPDAAAGMGCPSGGCIGYELNANLEFDTNGSGGADLGDDYWNLGAGWDPIGTFTFQDDSTSFGASFDGNGHTISNLFIDRSDSDYVGLFGDTLATAVISNVRLHSVDITGDGAVGGLAGGSRGTITGSDASGDVRGQYWMGMLVGATTGTVKDSYASGVVTGGLQAFGGLAGLNAGTIRDSYATTATVGEQAFNVGGLVGLSRGAITNSHATGAVSVSNNSYYVGGLVGENRGSITGGYAEGDVDGGDHGDVVGGLVGANSGSIVASRATNDVTSGADGDWIGGLVGYNYRGTITYSYATGSVASGHDSDLLGGLVGENEEGAISGSYATGSVSGADESNDLGGLVGENSSGSITASYATGGVTGGDHTFDIGGLIGQNSGGAVVASYTTSMFTAGSNSGLMGGLIGRNEGAVTGSYWDTNTSGRSTSDGGVGKTTSQLQSPKAYEGIYADWNVDVDNADGDDDAQTGVDDPWYFGGGGQYPTLRHGDYDADDDGLIEVGTLARLNAIRWDLDGDGVSGADGYAQAFPHPSTGMGCPDTGCAGYELSDDLDFDTDGDGSVDSGDEYWNDGDGWDPIADYVYPDDSTKFNATFDGNGHVIANLYVNRADTDRVGLFSITLTDSVIRNVGLTSANVTANGNVGGLVGSSFGDVQNSYVIGSVNGENHVGGLIGSQGSGEVGSSFALGTVNGDDYVGGLTGILSPAASISGSYASVNVSGNDRVGGLTSFNNGAIRNSYANGDVTGAGNAGGLVGYNSSANASTGIITNSYAVGMVSGDSNVGGLVGQDNLDLGIIEGSYWNVRTSGQTGSDGGDGKSIAELAEPIEATGIYQDWGGGSPWEFGTSREYPVLKADMNGDGMATWQECGFQRGVSVAVNDYRPVVGASQRIRAILRDMVPPARATYQWQRASSSGWRDVGPTSDTKGVEFGSPGDRTYRALVTLSPGVVLASDPAALSWRIGAAVSVSNSSPARGEPLEWTARLGGVECSSIDYAWRQVDSDETAFYLEPGNSDTKTGMLFRSGPLTMYVDINCSGDGVSTTYTSDRITVTATGGIWPYARVISDADDNVAPVGAKVVLSTNLERRHPPLNWRVTWERRFGNGEWREVGKPLSARHHLTFDSPGERTYRSSIYIIQLDETVKSDEVTVAWTP